MPFYVPRHPRLEAVEFADGQVTNANLSDYNVPAFGDLPKLTHELIEREGAEVHGLGETALPPIPPAIVQGAPPLTDTAIAMLDAEINRQALMIAYIDDFKLMMIISIVAVPLLLLLKKGKAGAGSRPAMAD
jgi:hypothetical protein